MMAVQKNKSVLIIALVALAILATIIIPANTAKAAPLTVNNHRTKVFADLNFYPGAPGGGRNGSFETPGLVGVNDEEIDTSRANPWQTRGATAGEDETKMHIIKSVSPNITAGHGSQFASINATKMGVLYQDLTLTPGQPYYIKFKFHGGNPNAADEMMFYFREKGSSVAGDSVSAASGAKWLDNVYMKTPTSANYEIAFETVHRTSNPDIWRGNYIDDVQVLTPSFLDADLSIKPETGDAAGVPVRYRDRYVTYILEVNNLGETGARKAMAHIPIVDGIDWSDAHAPKVTDITDANNKKEVQTVKDGNTVSFNIGTGGSTVGTGGSIAAKNTTPYRYEIRMRVTGKVTGTDTFIQPERIVRNQVKITYDDDIQNLPNNTTAGPYVNYTKSDSLAEFIYRESGVQGFIFWDETDDGYYDSGSEIIFPFLNAQIQVFDASTGEIATDEDGYPVRLSMASDALAGKFEIYGLLPGTYDIRLTELPGYMTSTVPDPATATSNKAKALKKDEKVSVIEGVVISGTTSSTLIKKDLLFGMKDNLTYRTVLKQYLVASDQLNTGSNPDTEMVGDGVKYVLDYGVPTRMDYTLYRNGPAISKDVTVVLLTPEGCKPEAIDPAGGKIYPLANGGYQVSWTLNGFTKTSEKFSVVFKPYLRPLDVKNMQNSYEVATMGRNDMFYIQVNDNKYDTNIIKGLYNMDGSGAAYADKDEEFTYKIDYRPRADADIDYSFYAKVNILEGENKKGIYISNIKGGHYTVTELDTNWKYKIMDSYVVQSGYIGPTYDGYAGVSYTYRNKLQSDKWVNGNAIVKNEMEQP